MIFSGQKKYEYRKRVFTRTDIDKVYVYASKPISKIIGFITIDQVIKCKASDMWEMTYKDGGVNKEYFDAYFKNCDTAHAIKIGEVVMLDIPIDPKKVIKDFHAPQNFMYLDFDL
jgi:predicted transcriptional regulator